MWLYLVKVTYLTDEGVENKKFSRSTGDYLPKITSEPSSFMDYILSGAGSVSGKDTSTVTTTEKYITLENCYAVGATEEVFSIITGKEFTMEGAKELDLVINHITLIGLLEMSDQWEDGVNERMSIREEDLEEENNETTEEL